jgi:hypothetical protein
VCGGDVAGDGQSESGSAVVSVAGLVQPGEFVEDGVAVLFWDAGSVVGDLEDGVWALIAESLGAKRPGLSSCGDQTALRGN